MGLRSGAPARSQAMLLATIALRVACRCVPSAAGRRSGLSPWSDRQLEGGGFKGADVGSGSLWRALLVGAGAPEQLIWRAGTLAKARLADLDRARGVAVGKDTTTLIGGQGASSAIAERIATNAPQPQAPVSAGMPAGPDPRQLTCVNAPVSALRQAGLVRRSAHCGQGQAHLVCAARPAGGSPPCGNPCHWNQRPSMHRAVRLRCRS